MRLKITTFTCLGLLATFIFARAGEQSELARAVAAGEAPGFPVSFSSYRGELNTLPIGVFDSGIGGLTVLAGLLSLDSFDNRSHRPGGDGRPDFESERFVYLGDQANMPYGNYAAEDGVDFLRELVVKDGIFLLGDRYWPAGQAGRLRRDKPPVKAIVIACNTATAYGLEDLRSAMELWGLPVAVIGVVEAGAEGTLESADSGSAVAVMATVGTCSSGGYVRAIEKAFNRCNRQGPAVVQQGCLGLAGAVEGDASYLDPGGTGSGEAYRGPAAGNPDAPLDTALVELYGFDPEGILGAPQDPAGWRLNSVENYIRYHCLSLVENYRQAGGLRPIGTVVLGCTHFPYYRESFLASFRRLREFASAEGGRPYAGLLADSLVMIDPALLTAEELYLALCERRLLLAEGEEPLVSTDEFYISVPNSDLEGVELTPAGAFSYSYKYGRRAGRVELEYVKRVPMSAADLSPGAIGQIRTGMPEVWKRMVEFSRKSSRCAGLPDSLKFQ
ncbi:MAG: aspartate/glutamate racemase family protein [Candidatus Glassbacteria bacterium]|nr:aspartate/glutamate racemase family protein [Candidatus Glassbacteria bacterium]